MLSFSAAMPIRCQQQNGDTSSLFLEKRGKKLKKTGKWLCGCKIMSKFGV